MNYPALPRSEPNLTGEQERATVQALRQHGPDIPLCLALESARHLLQGPHEAVPGGTIYPVPV